jgi:hypothetical protein
MKYISLIFLVFVLACNNNKSSNEKTGVNDTTRETKPSQNASSSSATETIDGMVGEWELAGVTEDKNGNDQLDSDERSAASNNAVDYMKLNSDGSAEFFQFRAKGRYEIRTNPGTGRKHLYLYTGDNFEYKKGYIMKVTQNELQIMNQFGGNSITIWKRL